MTPRASLGLALTLLPATSLSGCALVTQKEWDARVDLDGDGVSRPRDCDDGDATVGAPQALYVDADGDGSGGGTTDVRCPAPTGYATVGGDCDDANAEVHPGAVEACNGADDDCDGVIDNGVEPPTWYFDGDRDGYGTPFTSETACTAPAGYVATADDCDDTRADINPTTVWHPDLDGDGYGDAASGTVSCQQPHGLLFDGTDCDDTRPDVSPSGSEVCDDLNVDENCDGRVDDADPTATGQTLWYADADGDGLGTVFNTTYACDLPVGYTTDHSDCNDADASVTRDCAWVAVSAGYQHTCGLEGDGTVKCWGGDVYGESDPPATPFVALSAGTWSTCAVEVGGQIVCWGGGSDAAIPAGPYTAVQGDANGGCGLHVDGSIACWGVLPDGELPATDVAYTSMSVSYNSGCGLDTDGNERGWFGSPSSDGPYLQTAAIDDSCAELDADGFLHLPADLNDGSAPTGPFTTMSLGGDDYCAITSAGAIECWGMYAFGTSPSGVYTAIDVGVYYACGLSAAGAIACWGECDYGNCDPPTL